jgi:ABC-type multidrug transport system permease subunit
MSAAPYELRSTWALMRRGINEVARVPMAAVPGVLAPSIFMCGLAAVFGNLTLLPGFTTDDYLAFILPVGFLQGAGFTGAATGVNLARDIEQGWFDRLLVAPVPRPVLLLGPILGGVTRALVPVTVVLIAGLALGAEITGGAAGVLALYAAAAGFCVAAALWGVFIALTFRTQQAGPLMQQGVFLAVFLSTAYTPQVLLRGWLEDAAHFNPTSQILQLGRQATVSGIEPGLAHTWPGLVALLGLWIVLGALALRRLGQLGA